ncbi:MAG: hypothetical protein JKX81_17305 [Arenicella sp.]|nr:hypothetical protein [Arenicella sp.]
MKIMKLEEQNRVSKTDNLYKVEVHAECNSKHNDGVHTSARPLFVHSCYFFIALFVALALVNINAAHGQAGDDPFTPKPNLMWLSDDVNVSVFGDGEYSSFLGKSEIWTNNWGVSAKLLQNDNNDVFGLPKDSSYFNFDIKHRLFGSQDKSNLELGLGWQEMSIDSQLDASGPKVSLSGRYNVVSGFQVYGLTSYFPELEDELQDGEATGYEIEAGLLYQLLPSWSFKIGYRVFSLDLEDPIIEELGSSSAFLLGTDLSW